MHILLMAFLAVKLGAPLTLTESTTVDKLMAAPADLVGKTVQVKGRISEVCQMMGCWMLIVDPDSGKSVKISVKDGEIVFSKESIGKTAVAEGKLVKIELTRDQAVARAKHEAEDQNRKFDPKKIKSGITIYEIKGTGAVLED